MILDSWAVIALLKGEPGSAMVDRVVASREATMSWINLGEVFYIRARSHGEMSAAEGVDMVQRSVEILEPDTELVLDAARVKARERLSYADAFAVALAERLRMPLLTGDPEILALDREVQIIDPRSA